jgi:hypothetical protein
MMHTAKPVKVTVDASVMMDPKFLKELNGPSSNALIASMGELLTKKMIMNAIAKEMAMAIAVVALLNMKFLFFMAGPPDFFISLFIYA